MSATTRERRQPDRLLLFTTVLLCGAGLVMVSSASVALAYTQHQSAFYYAERQAAWMAIGFAGLFLLTVKRGATDPVCGMTVDRAKALRTETGERTLYFCSEHCRRAYEAERSVKE